MKSNKMRKLALILALMLALSTLLAGCGGGGGGDEGGGGGGDTVTFRLASDAPEDHIATGINNELCEIVNERTEGRVTIEYYPGSQLGGYETVYDELKMGSIDCAQISLPDASDTRTSMPYLPYYAKNFEEAKILYGPDSYMAQTFGEVTANDGVKFLGFVLEGMIGLGFTKEPNDITNPESDKGVKIRSATTAAFLKFTSGVGFDAVTVPYSEVPTAVQTNVVDGWDGGTANMNYAWLADVLNYFYFNYGHAEATCYVASEASLEKLSDEDRAIVEECFWEMSAKSFELAEENENEYMDKLREKGVEVYVFTEEEVQAYQDYCRENIWPDLAEDYGQETIDGLIEAMETLL